MLLRAAGYRRRAVLVGSGKHIEDVHSALVDEVHAPVDMIGFISLTPRPDNGLRSLGRIEDLAGGARSPPRAGGHHRRPRLPRGARGRSRRPVPPARRDRADRAVDDGDPRAPRGVRPGRVGAAVRAAPAGVRRLRLPRQAQLRLHRRAAADRAAQPAADRDRARGLHHLARPGALPLDPAGHRRRAVRLLQVPHDALGRRSAPGRPRVAQRGHAARCSRSAATRA